MFRPVTGFFKWLIILFLLGYFLQDIGFLQIKFSLMFDVDEAIEKFLRKTEKAEANINPDQKDEEKTQP